jgi:hypothetical protein
MNHLESCPINNEHMVLLILGPCLGPIHLWIPLEGNGGVGYGESRVENTKIKS